MKKLITSGLFVVCTTLSASTTMPSGDMDLSWVDEHISAIAQKRVGISNSKINSVNNPMKITIVKKKTKKTGPVVKGKKPKKVVVKADPLKLKAIMNSKALVGSKWYKVNDTILGYKVVAISSDKVHLSSKKKKKILFLNKTNKSIQIKSK